MNTVSKVISSMKDGTLKEKIMSEYFKIFIKNGNTRNKLVQDIALQKLRKKYTSILENIIKKYQDMPIEYSNKVWIFWRQGYENAPDLIKACFDSIKRHLTDREVVFLSEYNLHNYITLPAYIENKHGGGVIPEAQYSDIIRISLLAEYGGIWLDSTVFCTGNNFAEELKQWPLFFYKVVDTDRTNEPALICSNWLISCYTNVPFIRAIRDILYAYWESENHLQNYFIFHLFVHIVKDKFADEWSQIPTYNNVTPHIIQFEMLSHFDEDRFEKIKRMSDFHKLNRHIISVQYKDLNVDGSYYDLIRNRDIRIQ